MGVRYLRQWIQDLVRKKTTPLPSRGFDFVFVELAGMYKFAIESLEIDQSFSTEAELATIDLSDVVAHLFDTILAIVETLRPSKVLHLVMDGVSPLAKLPEQRERRLT
ncbi:MAG: hypothetical protein MHM6MM_008503, partial [Cercozoa sp. M6MM]